jgi:acyl carrier protein phosphodiesterase
MNFLAHIYLSGNNDLVKLGNFSADGIHGKKYLKFPSDMQKGILLHRSIDFFTDSHPIFKKSTKRLHANYGHYSGVIVDMFYDHFLAKYWNNYSSIPLPEYIEDFYKLLEEHYDILPSRMQKMMPTMIRYNWLLSYATIEGLQQILYQMNHRTKNRSKMHLAIKELEIYYEEFKTEFTLFFAELIEFSKNKLASL